MKGFIRLFSYCLIDKKESLHGTFGQKNGGFSVETTNFLINASYLLIVSCKKNTCMLPYLRYVPSCGISTKKPYEIEEDKIFFPKNEKRRIEIQERHDGK